MKQSLAQPLAQPLAEVAVPPAAPPVSPVTVPAAVVPADVPIVVTESSGFFGLCPYLISSASYINDKDINNRTCHQNVVYNHCHNILYVCVLTLRDFPKEICDTRTRINSIIF